MDFPILNIHSTSGPLSIRHIEVLRQNRQIVFFSLTKDLNEKDQMFENRKQVLNTNNEALAKHLKMELEKNNPLEATESRVRMDQSQQTEVQLLHS
ncbi:hypothetical protein EYF80_016273 [Liparis tanakae]|uniref:Uncharacterized protein n=1 Tax=Liparis tanakae TaxID=230148 RepID=A0A4Z2I8P4_9TELE|nr:hypothetical protein EYF80_016273 [Liparis tanakae]